ncbi:hypothetical protein QJS04_geneDACA017825 [Acorus gramineus]|uniref:Uncharacterized protein n=1 Tax=Acorus gramineus TaxID=55184 RepID=A0AAV9A3D2_ACOGR|nr:hypothetical protein QJS04_geneDACA017825 [Acorus gramineus]
MKKMKEKERKNMGLELKDCALVIEQDCDEWIKERHARNKRKDERSSEENHGSNKRQRRESSERDAGHVLNHMIPIVKNVHENIPYIDTAEHFTTHWIPHKYRGSLYHDLIGFVSIYALEKIEEQIQANDSGGPFTDICDHKLLTTCGLPCFHMITGYEREGAPIPLVEIHPFWHKFECNTPYVEGYIDAVDIGPEIELLLSRFKVSNIAQQKETKKCPQELSDPSTNLLLEPPVKIHTRGRKRSGKAREQVITEESTKRDKSGFEYVIQSTKQSN